MTKQADNQFPIHPLLAQRWSPRAFADKPVSPGLLGSLFEAARWAASCYNEQPWRFIIARREEGDAFEKMLSCLVPGNQDWARQAPVLGLGIAKKTFSRNGKPNVHARHDLGLATASLMLHATELELYVHAMGGILPDRAAEVYQVPDDFEVATGLAIGYLGDPESLPEGMQADERAVRERRPLAETVFASAWETPADFALS